jgi:hypothetical protein
MNDVLFNWIDLLLFLAAMASCGTVAGLACWAMNIAAIKAMKGAARVQRKQWQEIPKMNKCKPGDIIEDPLQGQRR